MHGLPFPPAMLAGTRTDVIRIGMDTSLSLALRADPGRVSVSFSFRGDDPPVEGGMASICADDGRDGIALASITLDHPTAVLRVADYGDTLTGALYVTATGDYVAHIVAVYNTSPGGYR